MTYDDGCHQHTLTAEKEMAASFLFRNQLDSQQNYEGNLHPVHS